MQPYLFIFEVVSFGEISDEKAAKIARHYYRTHKFKKNDKGKKFTIVAPINQDHAELL